MLIRKMNSINVRIELRSQKLPVSKSLLGKYFTIRNAIKTICNVSCCDVWNQVLIEMRDDGHAVAFATFNASGTNKQSWMSAERLLNSSWDDLTPDTQHKNPTVSVDGMYVYNVFRSERNG